MSPAGQHTTSRIARALTTIALGLAAAACGGGGDDEPGIGAKGVKEAPAQALSPAFVTVQGCVLDRHYIPTTGTPVRVLAIDGRLLGSARSDSQGRFTLRLPAQGDVLLQVDRPQGESLPMRVDAQAPTWATCLLDDERA